MGIALNPKKGSTKVRSWLWNGMIAAAIALPASSGLARAKDLSCSERTLRGDYAFSVVNLTTQSVVVGLAEFDGKGGFAQIDYPGDRLRTAGTLDFRMGQTGSYAINADCTGTMEIDLNVQGVPAGTSHGVIHNVIVISNGGRSIHGVVAGVTPPGQPIGTLSPGQTRVDFWKVASEQDD
jgi:hypothetical protein